MKYVIVNRKAGLINGENPLTEEDLFEISFPDPPLEKDLTIVSTSDGGFIWEPIAKKKLKEVIIQSKDQLLSGLRADTLYVIDGDIALGEGEHIIVPESGLNIMGYSFDASRIGSYGVANHKIFKSSESGSGNLVLHNIAFTTTGEGAGVFDITDSDGSHALEMVTVNFEGCNTLGKITGYRQGTGITIGIYGCKNGLELDGAWNGFKLTNTNAFSFGENASMFPAGANLTFKNRFYLEINIDLPPTSSITDATPANFLEQKLLQINTTMAKVGGTIDPVTNTPLLFPNISPEDSEALFTGNIGIINSSDTPYGINTANLVTATDDADASTKLVPVGYSYVESSTGYLKTRMV